ncbi:MAG: hypothetical protein ABIR81_03615, partial [Ginsengibacter sp.]
SSNNSSTANSLISNSAIPITPQVTQSNITSTEPLITSTTNSASSVINPANTSLKSLSYYDFDDNLEAKSVEQTLISDDSYNRNILTPIPGTADDNNLSDLASQPNKQPNAKPAQFVSSPEYFVNHINNLPVALLDNDKALSQNSANVNASSIFLEQLTDESKISKNIKLKKIRNSKVRWMYSIAPTVSYRKYTTYEALDANTVLSGLTNAVPTYDVNRKSSHHPSSGLEAGITLKYPLNKYFRFTSGFQVNYSSYIIEANTIHSTTATLLLQNERTGMPYAFSNISYYGNGVGVAPINLRNYSVSMSLPVGLEYLLGGNDRVKFYAAATAQPVLALTSRTYVLSTDNKNYLRNARMARHINMATNFGAFMSVNSKKINWQLGPQVNYQVLSSFTDVYPVKEHYVNYGIKLAFGRK